MQLVEVPEEICSQNVGVEGKQEATAPIIPAAELQESGRLTDAELCSMDSSASNKTDMGADDDTNFLMLAEGALILCSITSGGEGIKDGTAMSGTFEGGNLAAEGIALLWDLAPELVVASADYNYKKVIKENKRDLLTGHATTCNLITGAHFWIPTATSPLGHVQPPCIAPSAATKEAAGVPAELPAVPGQPDAAEADSDAILGEEDPEPVAKSQEETVLPNIKSRLLVKLPTKMAAGAASLSFGLAWNATGRSIAMATGTVRLGAGIVAAAVRLTL